MWVKMEEQAGASLPLLALSRAAYKGPHVRVESEEDRKLVGAKDRSKRLIWHL